MNKLRKKSAGVPYSNSAQEGADCLLLLRVHLQQRRLHHQHHLVPRAEGRVPPLRVSSGDCVIQQRRHVSSSASSSGDWFMQQRRHVSSSSSVLMWLRHTATTTCLNFTKQNLVREYSWASFGISSFVPKLLSLKSDRHEQFTLVAKRATESESL